VIATAAAFGVSAATVRRVRVQLERFARSALYREKSARYDATAPSRDVVRSVQSGLLL
jgi:hypothetical protein